MIPYKSTYIDTFSKYANIAMNTHIINAFAYINICRESE